MHDLNLTVRDPANRTYHYSRRIEIRNNPTGSTQVFPAVADTYIDFENPGSNFGASASLNLRHWSDNGAVNSKFGVLKFDLSSISGTISSAKLRIFNSASTHLERLRAWHVPDTTWTESGLTYSNFVSSGLVLVNSLYYLAPGAWHEIDVTDAVTSGSITSIGLLTGDLVDRSIASRESNNPPQLIVTIAP